MRNGTYTFTVKYTNKYEGEPFYIYIEIKISSITHTCTLKMTQTSLIG